MSQRTENLRPTELAEPDQAIEQLLETLLAEVPDHVAVQPQPKEQKSVVVEAPVETPLNLEPPAPITEQEAEQASEPEPEPVARTLRPEWAQGDLKILLFRIGDQRMGVPLVCLNSIAKLDQLGRPMALPAQPAWHRGVLDYRGSKLVLADLVEFLKFRSSEPDPEFLLVIGNDGYGLVCDAIEEPVSVPADELNWRDPRDSRHWMLGMMPQQMCVLIDPDAIADGLAGATGTGAESGTDRAS